MHQKISTSWTTLNRTHSNIQFTVGPGHSIETRIKDHHCHIHLYHLYKSAVAEHSINMGHCSLPNDNSIMVKKSRCMDRIIREVTEVLKTLTRRMGSP
jgi:hypothetical protein